MFKRGTIRIAFAIALFGLAAGNLIGMAPHASASGVPYHVGDVFVGIGAGQIRHHSPTGTVFDTLDSGTVSPETTGMTFDKSGNLYGTDFQSRIVTKYDQLGNVVGQFTGGPLDSPESIVQDSSGNFYVGDAGPGVFITPTHPLLKFDSNGNFLTEFFPAVESRGADWIDLASDQCTLLYTSEGVRVHRFDVCQNKQLPDFATLPILGPVASGGEVAFALRIRPNGEVLVAAWTRVFRLDANGNIIQQYRIPGVGVPGFSRLFALNLDPDGTSFWTAEQSSGQVFKVDINTGNVLTSFTSPPNPPPGGASQVSGLAVFGELYAAKPRSIVLAPPTATHRVGDSATLTATLVNFTAPAGTPVTFTVNGGNPQTQTATADANGNATLSYVGTNAGTDTVVASSETVTSNTATVIWHKPETTLTESADFTHAGAPFTTTFTYTETNSGTDPISGVSLAAGQCQSPTYVSGDANNNGILDPGETWTYTCTTTFTVPGSSTVTATATGTDTVDQLAAPPEAASLTVTAFPPAPPATPGFWKNHPAAMSPLLPLKLGSYTVTTTAAAGQVFVAMNCANSSAQNAVGCLAGQLLAAELNVANNSSNACIYTTMIAANAFLESIGYVGPSGTYTLTTALRSTALDLADRLSNFNEGIC